MPVNPHIKGGSDVPVTDGGTGSSTGSGALANLGGLDTAAHAMVNHAGIPGVGDLTTAAHASVDHSGITGVGGSPLGNGTVGSSTGSLIVPANTISNPGEYLRFLIGYANNSTSNTITATLGGATVLSRFIGNSSSVFEGWIIEITYLGSNNWRYTMQGFGNQAVGQSGDTGTISVNPTGALTFAYGISPASGGEQWSTATGFGATG